MEDNKKNQFHLRITNLKVIDHIEQLMEKEELSKNAAVNKILLAGVKALEDNPPPAVQFSGGKFDALFEESKKEIIEVQLNQFFHDKTTAYIINMLKTISACFGIELPETIDLTKMPEELAEIKANYLKRMNG
ncbi:MAG: hypothetical protein FWE36_08165 [Erysipelotrichales bacterium]|nr:hypothetical protein [Erysipelotrichales bacterium]